MTVCRSETALHCNRHCHRDKESQHCTEPDAGGHSATRPYLTVAIAVLLEPSRRVNLEHTAGKVVTPRGNFRLFLVVFRTRPRLLFGNNKEFLSTRYEPGASDCRSDRSTCWLWRIHWTTRKVGPSIGVWPLSRLGKARRGRGAGDGGETTELRPHGSRVLEGSRSKAAPDGRERSSSSVC